MTHRNVLIAGAGIAGPTLAYWLGRHGMQATVVERAPVLREGGQTVDLRGAGRDVARKMGPKHTLLGLRHP
ncbi:FAD-dependent monooxygenase [Streptomyces anulatus]|uniref:FAD-dependent monooxygenase n=1 Tax=Streptomyces anulatus TaxID=1892 RepID=UPI0037BA4AD5